MQPTQRTKLNHLYSSSIIDRQKQQQHKIRHKNNHPRLLIDALQHQNEAKEHQSQINSIIANYQSKIKQLENSFDRTKQMLETSIKNIYKQKIILMNIISHNQQLITQFKNKICFEPTTPIQDLIIFYSSMKNNVVKSLLCIHCQSKVEKGKEQEEKHINKHRIIKNPQLSNKKEQKKLSIELQYQLNLYPQSKKSNSFLVERQNNTLKNNIFQLVRQNEKRVKQLTYFYENKLMCIEQKLKEQTKPQIYQNNEKDKLIVKQKQKIAKLEEKLEAESESHSKNEQLIKQLNNKLISNEINFVNTKYKNKHLY